MQILLAFFVIVLETCAWQCREARRIGCDHRFSLLMQKSPMSPPSLWKKQAIDRLLLVIPSVAALSYIYVPKSVRADSSCDLPRLILRSDELELNIDSDFIGLGLQEQTYKGRNRVYIGSIKDGACEEIVNKAKVGMILVGVNDREVEGLRLEDIYPALKTTTRPLRFIFRDVNKFMHLLTDRSAALSSFSGAGLVTVDTTIVPAVVARSGLEQYLTVESQFSSTSNASLVVRAGDVVEIVGRVTLCSLRGAEKGTRDNWTQAQARIMNSIDAVTEEVNRFLISLPDSVQSLVGDVSSTSVLRNDSVFFVVGRAPTRDKYTTFTTTSPSTTSIIPYLQSLYPSWDQTVLGLSVGDRRRLILPTALFLNKDSKTLYSALQSKMSVGGEDDARLVLVVDWQVMSINGRVA